MGFDNGTNTLEIFVYFIVGKSQYTNTQSVQTGCPRFVIFHCLRLIMLGTVQFNRQRSFVAVKIHNIFANNTLPCKTRLAASKKVIPQAIFLPGGIRPKFTRTRFQGFIAGRCPSRTLALFSHLQNPFCSVESSFPEGFPGGWGGENCLQTPAPSGHPLWKGGCKPPTASPPPPLGKGAFSQFSRSSSKNPNPFMASMKRVR